MRAIVAYMHWIGDDLEKGQKPKGSGIVELKYLDRAADPAKGAVVYQNQCASCHGQDGLGKPNETGGYVYPPLWGPSSYNVGAGLFRLSRLAGYVKMNMPFLQATYKIPVLSDEQAWDVAAFVNSRPRPNKDLSGDWPNISKKPIDHPFGPYKDGFSEEQHKFGPFNPIVEKRKSMQKGS
jgi:thiosulfate dehydrogenase